MHSSSNSSHKDQLLDALQRAERATSELEQRAQGLLAEAAQSHELTSLVQPVIQAAPDDSALPIDTWNELTAGFQALGDHATSRAFFLAGQGSTFSAASSLTQLTTTMSRIESSGWITGQDAVRAATELATFLHRPTLLDEVAQLMAEFALHVTTPPQQSALELIREADVALRVPATTPLPPAPVLIPARESIHVAISALLRRRPFQEPASSILEKMRSLVRQCGVQQLVPEHSDHLAAVLTTLFDRLSAAKQLLLPQPEIRTLFDETLHFHQAFLRSLNPTSFKGP